MRAQLAGPRLWLGDRQFCDLTQPAVFAVDSDHYVVRYHPKTPFYPDPACPPQQGTDAQGWAWQKAWGGVGQHRRQDKAGCPSILHRYAARGTSSKLLVS